MALQNVLEKIGGSYESDTVFHGKNKKTKADNHIRFGSVFDEALADGSDVSDINETMSTSSFSVGSTAELMSTVFRMKEPAFAEELDTSIDFDSLEELDRFAEENAAPNITSISDVFDAFDSDDGMMSEEFGLEEIV